MNNRQRHALTHPLIGDTDHDLAVTLAEQITDRRSKPGFLILSTLAVDR